MEQLGIAVHATRQGASLGDGKFEIGACERHANLLERKVRMASVDGSKVSHGGGSIDKLILGPGGDQLEKTARHVLYSERSI
jgi:hypothetical protein